ncbi:MAG: hypothetical protein ACI4QG_02980, partial [Candidatus Cryptobacteroides sp.]
IPYRTLKGRCPTRERHPPAIFAFNSRDVIKRNIFQTCKYTTKKQKAANPIDKSGFAADRKA